MDRQREFRELDEIQGERGAHLVIVYGRRVGTTTLLLEWLKQTGLPCLYWVTRRETPAACRQNLSRALWQWAYPGEQNLEPPRHPALRRVPLRARVRSCIRLQSATPRA